VLLGETLHRILAQRDLSLGGSRPEAATVRELRWSNRKRVCEHYPALLRDVSQAVAEFCDAAIDRHLARSFTFWRWPLVGKAWNRLYENRYKRALEVAYSSEDRQLVETIWQLALKRHQLDLEFRLHMLGRLWLLFHGPAALALLVLLIEHIGMSMRFGGF
jgi:hypothetical protein